ncbi:MAG: hypothetical protein IJ770_04385 [Alphaproteobacteria bacterium]|nr:hypothetical protein [Alphaproteobacteria bacterium]
MIKKIVVIALMLALFGWSLTLIKKTEPEKVVVQADNPEEQTIQAEETLPETAFSFNTQNVTTECSEELSEMFCAVENAVKCTLKPDLENCAKLNLPQFIFMTDPTAERPTEMNYKFINKKVQPNGTTHIYTESSCNGSWFGLCQGTVIYVVGQSKNDKWFVKDIYAIE